MRIAIVRHAIALDRDEAAARGIDDADRPLTDAGRDKMARSALGLACLLPRPALLATSPWRRARATADIVADAFGVHQVVTTPALLPGRLQPELLDWISERDDPETIILVGHEPDLGLWSAWLISGRTRPMLRLKKGSACCIDFHERPAPGGGELQWLLTPRQLRRIGGSD